MAPMQHRTHAERAGASAFGPALKGWRARRGLSQEQLAEEAQVSTRHLSCLETGRATPSRDMVLVLSSALELPLRERNELLSAAGFAKVYRDEPMDAPAMRTLDHAVEQLLQKLDPYPAVVVDRAWNVVRMNGGATRMLPLMIPDDAPPEVTSNLLVATLHPRGARAHLVNWAEIARAVLERMHHELQNDADDSPRRAMYERALSYPGVREALSVALPATPLPFVPVHVRRNGLEARFFTMLTTIGTPQDVTAQELTIEAYFPADDATRALCASLAPS